MATRTTSVELGEKKHKKRPGIVSKCKSSNNKKSKHYIKAYRGQGR